MWSVFFHDVPTMTTCIGLKPTHVGISEASALTKPKLTLAGETYSDPVNVDLDHFLPLSNLDIIPPVKLGVAKTLYFLASMDHLGSWVFSHAESRVYDL